MAVLLTASNLSKTYATHQLFAGLAIGLVENDRLGLIGPNGSGKSTLLKILAGWETADDGEITRRRQLKLAYVPQEDRFEADATPWLAVIDPLQRNQTNSSSSDDHGLDVETRTAIALSKLGFKDVHQAVASLSGGWRKRLSIACAIADEPDVLLLDEPTNHLDFEGVLWLEQFVRQAAMAIVFITHDRTFLNRTAGRIIELSRAYPGGMFEVKGDYTEFVRRKEEFLDVQAARQTALAGKVRRDNAWLLQGVQGRQTRNKSQIAAADHRRAELKAVKARNAAPTQTTAIRFQASQRKTKKLLVAHRVSKAMGGRLIFEQLDLSLSPGVRLGLLGPNGSGKTTLLRLLAGDLKPDSGTLKTAADLRIVNFTQHRDALKPTQSLREALCQEGDRVLYHGKSIHVAAWAKKFLFEPSKFNISVGDLSGGEQARIMLANLMLQPADVLILDEPTNDLDIPSLEVLEQALDEFPGAIVLVTHDRFMLSRLSTELLALDGRGRVKRYITYTQWQDDQTRGETLKNEFAASVAETSSDPGRLQPAHPKASTQTKKLSYKLQRELNAMEQTILEAESEFEALQAQAADPGVITDHLRHAQVCDKLGEAQSRVQQLYHRWAELEAMCQR